MKTEARKSFRTGFVLTEEELRRIVNVARQQLEKAGVVEVVESLEVKFKNGTISDIGSLDELLSLENVGSKEIIRLEIRLAAHGGSLIPDHYVAFQFRNAVVDDESRRPISYEVRGTERDWVFVTASELDERVAKVKSRAFPRIPYSKPFGFLLGLTVALFIMLSTIKFPQMANSPSAAEAIESRWKAGTLRDPVEAIIIQQKFYERDRALFKQIGLLSPRYFSLVVFGTPIALIAVSELLLALLYYLYPAHVFSWGDNAKLYERRVQIRGYVLTVILVALVISVIGSIIGNKLTLPR